MRTRLPSAIVALMLALFATARTSFAPDNFPARPIRVVIPYGPGTVADVFGRIVAQNMAAQWNGASIVFESESGAN